ncbi:MAG: hypothetical protein DDT41_01750 [candidate division WS2 bacterium]|nr:hypothetical protein [Candidatus Psychracetigena formicireducens]
MKSDIARPDPFTTNTNKTKRLFRLKMLTDYLD